VPDLLARKDLAVDEALFEDVTPFEAEDFAGCLGHRSEHL
jgi:hypothetical protein